MTPCPRCGAPLPADDSPCPRCLMELALGSAGDGRGFVSPTDPTLSLASAPTLDLPPEMEAAPSSRFAAGEHLGSYRLVRPLGRGGFGEVWEAEDERDQRRVALKLLTEDLSPAARERFRREGRIAASIHHPRVVFLFAAEELDGVPALAMELVVGGTLKDLVEQRGPLPWREAVARILELVDGLEAAHAKGILHRDIKPSNCFVDEKGEVKIGDFGLSRPTDGGDDFTKTGTYLGTPAYSSPEQVRGQRLDVRSDLFSLGATFYYLLTGRAPFAGEGLGQVLASVLASAPPAVASHGIALPRGLERTLAKLLAKNPDNRYRDYSALRAALQPYLPTRQRAGDLARRAAAYIVDANLVSLLASAGAAVLQLIGIAVPVPDLWIMFSGSLLMLDLATANDIALHAGLQFLYFTWVEVSYGRSAGKFLFGLSVRKADGTPLDLLAGMLRPGCFLVLSAVSALILGGLGERALADRSDFISMILSLVNIAVAPSLLIALPMRSANGFMGLHELLSGTRVIRTEQLERRSPRNLPVQVDGPRTLSLPPETHVLGPYRVLDVIDLDASHPLLLGFDPLLFRSVWLRPRDELERSQASTLIKLQTLDIGGTAWDVFTALEGAPLFASTSRTRPLPWSEARTTLAGIASALAEIPQSSSVSIDRLWETSDSRVVILPFPPPGSALPLDEQIPAGPRQLLRNACLLLLEGSQIRSDPLPSGHSTTRPLPRLDRVIVEAIVSETAAPAEFAERLRERRESPASVSRRRRCAALAFLSTALIWANLDVLLPVVLGAPDEMPTSDSLAQEDAPLMPLPHRLLLFAGLLALPLSVITREGGLSLRLAQIEVVRRDGAMAGPIVRFSRALTVWSPAAGLALLDWGPGPVFSSRFVQLVLLTVYVGGAAFAIARPQRGIQDLVAGTALVPK